MGNKQWWIMTIVTLNQSIIHIVPCNAKQTHSAMKHWCLSPGGMLFTSVLPLSGSVNTSVKNIATGEVTFIRVKMHQHKQCIEAHLSVYFIHAPRSNMSSTTYPTSLTARSW